jgi:hypothetical protein
VSPPSVALLDTVDDFVAELDQIESIFAKCRGDRTVTGFSVAYTPTEEGCLFALWDAWTRFLRSLIIASCKASVIGLSGQIYMPPTARSESQALTYLDSNRRGRNFRIINGEPKWNNPLCLADIANALSLPNERTIVSAITATSVVLGPLVVASPLEEMRVARNFAAHKNASTLSDLAEYSVTAFSTLSDHIRASRSGVEAFSEWKDCLSVLAESAAQ